MYLWKIASEASMLFLLQEILSEKALYKVILKYSKRFWGDFKGWLLILIVCIWSYIKIIRMEILQKNEIFFFNFNIL